MKIALDLKISALYGGGIAHWISAFLPSWIKEVRNNHTFSAIVPVGPELKPVILDDVESISVKWPIRLTRPFRHPLYDNVLFPRALDKVNPKLIFSPYYDVRMPSSTPSVITIHDLCYLDVGHCYPWRLRSYYIHMLRVNLSRALHVITVSEATKERLIDSLQVPRSKISVVPNALDPVFASLQPNRVDIECWREKMMLGDTRQALVLYPGGMEYRKNIPKLMQVMRRLWAKGHQIKLLITGDLNLQWKNQFSDLEFRINRVHFLGYLSQADLRIAYEASDCIIYPTLCEGFGRVCLEAMAAGTPLACSDLQVLREVAGNYPSYFNPNDEDSMSAALLSALASGSQHKQEDDRFTLASVQKHFASALDPILEKVKRL